MQAFINTKIEEKIAEVTFHHPQSNSFPSSQLVELSQTFEHLSKEEDVNVILLKSKGKTFCAGASFDELLQIKSLEESQKFFNSFGQLLNSMKNCSKTIVCSVQGKAVGGGVGIICAADYVIASEDAAIKLSELGIGFGPYVIEPIVSKKMGQNNFYHMTLNPKSWFDTSWCRLNGVIDEIFISADLEEKSLLKAKEISEFNKESLKELKRIYWSDLKDYEIKYQERAAISGRLILSKEVKEILENFKNK